MLWFKSGTSKILRKSSNIIYTCNDCPCGDWCDACYSAGVDQWSVTFSGLSNCGSVDVNGTYILNGFNKSTDGSGNKFCHWYSFSPPGSVDVPWVTAQIFTLGVSFILAGPDSADTASDYVVYRWSGTLGTCTDTYTHTLFNTSNSSCPSIWPASVDLVPYP